MAWNLESAGGLLGRSRSADFNISALSEILDESSSLVHVLNSVPLPSENNVLSRLKPAGDCHALNVTGGRFVCALVLFENLEPLHSRVVGILSSVIRKVEEAVSNMSSGFNEGNSDIVCLSSNVGDSAILNGDSRVTTADKIGIKGVAVRCRLIFFPIHPFRLGVASNKLSELTPWFWIGHPAMCINLIHGIRK